MVGSFGLVLRAGDPTVILCCSPAGTLCNGSFKVELSALFRGRSASCWQNGRQLSMFQEAGWELSEPCRNYVQIQCCPRGFDGCPQMAPKVCILRHGTARCHELCVHPILGTGAPRSHPRWMEPQDISFQSPLVFQLLWLGTKDEA